MKPKLNKELTIKVIFILSLMILAPFVPELLLFVDMAGIELAIAFFTLYFANAFGSCRAVVSNFKVEIVESAKILSRLYLFKPKVYGFHSVASSAFYVVTGSVVFSAVLWLPVLMASSAGMANMGMM